MARNRTTSWWEPTAFIPGYATSRSCRVRPSQFPLGCHTAAYIADGKLAELPADAFVSMSAPGISAAAYPIRGGRTATFFLHDAAERLIDRSPEACRRELEACYRGRGWVLDQLLGQVSTRRQRLFRRRRPDRRGTVERRARRSVGRCRRLRVAARRAGGVARRVWGLRAGAGAGALRERRRRGASAATRPAFGLWWLKGRRPGGAPSLGSYPGRGSAGGCVTGSRKWRCEVPWHPS